MQAMTVLVTVDSLIPRVVRRTGTPVIEDPLVPYQVTMRVGL
jgi:hypothetical protein